MFDAAHAFEALGEMLSELKIGASLVDRDLRLVWCNSFLRKDTSDLELEGPRHCFAIHWRRRTRCPDCLPLQTFQTGQPQGGYRERKRPGESPRLYWVRALPIHDAKGEVGRVLEIFVEVGDLAAYLSHEWPTTPWRDPDPVGKGSYVVDTRGRIVSWSSEMAMILGFTPDDVMGRLESVLFATNPADAPAGGASSWERGVSRLEGAYRSKDERHVAVATSTEPIRDAEGNVCAYRTLVEDLSDLSRLRREVRIGHRAMAGIMGGPADAIFSTDIEGRVTAWSEGAAQALGHELAETEGLTLAALMENRDEAQKLLFRIRATGASHRQGLALRHRTGRQVVMDASATALQSAGGRCVGLLFVGRELHRRNQLEQQIVRAERLAAVGSLLVGLAHEIATPLNVISASTEYALLDLPPEHGMRAELTTVLDETERVTRLLEDLLGYARSKAAATAMTSPRAAVHRVLRLLALQVDKRSIQVEIKADAEVQDVALPEDAVHQMLLNVMVNALAAIEDRGRIVVEIREGPPRGSDARSFVCLSVDDDGPGVPPALRRRVLEPFFTTRPDGTGLGLAVCNRIATDHGGRIEVGESNLGGARVEAHLPAVQRDEEQREAS